ncbi:MAG TPA: aminotransferase class V-fold PLP-dependent enzyme [Myxococcales bacterium]|nr:aminotransferase class V-fold PLP-dependent enzyme [Myxococcales bacterium]
MYAELARHWTLDPAVAFLNHGSFGACPSHVLAVQQELRARIERQPVLFLSRELESLLDAARAALGQFVDADPDDLAFVPNATTGVNTVLRSLRFGPGDELLTTDHAYNACRNALRAVAQSGARVVTTAVPWPGTAPARVVDAVLGAVTARTRLALLDHVTSPTGLIFPVETLVRALQERGVDTVVDGAHAPGMLSLSIRGLGAAYYTGNCHKWLCTPKGSGFLHVRRDRQERMLPLAISHGYNSNRTDRSRFRLLFDWGGTDDPTPFLCIPEAIRFLGALLPGGWPELMQRNRALALEGRAVLCAALRIPEPAPAEMIGSLASVPLPDSTGPLPDPGSLYDPVQRTLYDRYRIEVPVFTFPEHPRRLVRISAQLYNSRSQFELLARALTETL